MSSSLDHSADVARGERFRFGKNWASFLKRLTDHRIAMAEKSLRESLQAEHLDNKTFIDVGSGSGLFSLAARRLGAKVRSFDYDPQSFACTQELRRRYFPNDPNWVVEQGSVLDRAYLAKLGTFDIVYSWGVLHHTGAMWQALENVKPLVPVGGQLFIAIYNDLGEATDKWAEIKKKYNALPAPMAWLFALKIIGSAEAVQIYQHARQRNLGGWLKTWTDYQTTSTRGMSRWHDWIDWIGGHPYERATTEQIAEFYARDGFRLTHLVDRSSGSGCNEFVFSRDADAGVLVESEIRTGNSLSYRFGVRVVGPFEQSSDGWLGTTTRPIATRDVLYLMRDDALVGEVRLEAGNRVRVAGPEESRGTIEKAKLYVVAAKSYPLNPPFDAGGGKMWGKVMLDLGDCSDDESDNNRSPVFIFEDGKQLKWPHSIHDDIRNYGGGRFSHWGPSILFSSTDSSDPNTNGRTYTALRPS